MENIAQEGGTMEAHAHMITLGLDKALDLGRPLGWQWERILAGVSDQP
jgi:hypothetical protein